MQLFSHFTPYFIALPVIARDEYLPEIGNLSAAFNFWCFCCVFSIYDTVTVAFACSFILSPSSYDSALLQTLRQPLASLATYGGGVRRLTGEISCTMKTVRTLYIGEKKTDSNHQGERSAADGSHTLPQAYPQVEAMLLRMSQTMSGRWDWPATWALPVALWRARKCYQHFTEPEFGGIALCGLSHLDLEELMPMQALAMLSHITLDLEDGEATSMWSLSALLQLFPVGQAIVLKDLGWPSTCRLVTPPLQHLTHIAGLWVGSQNLVLPHAGVVGQVGKA